ncbi:MAG TPA: asparagine synthase-related protein [Burkholderiaceae bacterium]
MSHASCLYALVAKTSAARDFLAAQLPAALPATFPQSRDAWWLEPHAGLAIHAPVSDACGAFAAVGRVRRPESGWTPLGERTTDEAMLRQLCVAGPRALATLEGGHAAVFWDGARQELSLLRDAFGQQTLFVREDVAFFVVCSELEPLLRDPRFHRALDVESAYHYLAFGSPVPGRTLARRVTRVRAGHLLRWTPGAPLIEQRHFTPLSHGSRKVAGDAGRDEIARTLEDAILARSVPGRQALLLSGGIDSSYIGLTLAEHAGADQLDTYTVEFAAPWPGNEGEYAAIVARQAGLRHALVPMSPADAARHLPKVLRAAEPCSAWASVTHHHLLDRIVGDGHGLLHSGLGADEVFGGYSRFLDHYQLQREHETAFEFADRIDPFDAMLWQPAQAGRRLFQGVPRFFSDEQLAGWLQQPCAGWDFAALLTAFYRDCRRIKPSAHLFELMVAHECQHRVPDLLFADFEPIARSRSLATVYPFLDTAVARQACGLGASERFSREGETWRNKRLLREIASRRLPPEIMARKPVSYNAPILLWLKDPAFADIAMAYLDRCILTEIGLLSEEGLRHIRDGVTALTPQSPPESRVVLDQAWAVITLAAWVEEWIGRTPA